MRSLKLTHSLVLLFILIGLTAIVFVWLPSSQKAARRTLSNPKMIDAAVQPIATTFTVNLSSDLVDSSIGDGHCDTDGNLGNGDQCTLRAAIQEGGFANQGDSINFNLPAGTVITLNSGLPFFIQNVSIVGPGSKQLTVQRNTAAGTPNFTIFSFAPINGNFNNSISGLTIANGSNPNSGSTFPQGGCVFNMSPVVTSLTDVTFSGCTGTIGGAINNSGTLTLMNSTLSGNTSPNGAGTYNSGSLTITNSTISGNNAANGAGGGIDNSGSSAIANVSNSTISNNSCDAQGAGIVNSNSGSFTLTNSTISGNTARGTLTPGEGGAANMSGTMTLTNVTVTANSASNNGTGGIANGSGTVNLSNSIVAQNTGGLADLNGTFTSQGFNFVGKSSGNGLTNGVNGDQVGSFASPINPLLGPLADNGGLTKTHALLVGSSAIDAGNSAQTTDQRGQPRPIDDSNVTNAAGGNATDIGAYEANIFQVNTTVDADDGACTAIGTGNGCTLREAINAANVNLGEVSFAPALTSGGPALITLATALPAISSRVIIQGPGSALLTIERSTAGGTPEFSVFVVNSGAVGTISKLSISKGKVSNPNPGGGILNSGTLTLNDSTVIASNPVGIRNAANLTINNSFITSNASGGISSSIGDGSSISLTVNNSVVSTNFGTGISSNASNGNATLTISGSTISNNTGGFLGGGVANGAGSFTSTAVLTISNSTISGNSSTNGGGGVYNAAVFASASATATINNTTISGNSDNTGGGGIYDVTSGPGVTSNLTLTNCTITNNNVAGSGSGGGIGISIFQNPAVVKLRNSIVAGNLKNSSTPDDIAGSVDATSSFNLIGTGGAGGLANGTNNNQVGVANPGLGALANNGGPTMTQALLPGSPAIEAGDNCVVNNSCSPALASALTTDQRGTGFNRSADGNGDATAKVDIGAFEVQSVVVTSTNDSGAGSLRQAITDANANQGTKAINFLAGITGIIDLLTALPDLSTSMSINGPGANLLTVRRSMAGGTPNFRIFTISGPSTTISGLTITNGRGADAVSIGTGGVPGGGLQNSAGSTLNLRNVVITGNRTGDGGGGAGIGGGSGGGVFNLGVLTIVNSTISNNVTGFGGNGLGPGGVGGSGGGIANSGTLTLINSTVSGNQNGDGGNGGTGSPSGYGGGGAGILNSSSLTLINTTVANNRTGNGGAGSGNASGGGLGGGISNSGTLTLINSTIDANQTGIGGNGGAGGNGGGIWNQPSFTVNVANTIIAGNSAGSGGTGPDLSGSFSSQDYNLIKNTSGAAFTGSTTHTITGLDPLLAPLANNGGSTMTNALLPGSPAIDAGSNANLPADTFDLDGDGNTTEPIPFDQRGFARAGNGTVDIGAFESRGFTISATSGTPQSTAITASFASPLTATVTSAFGEPVTGGFVSFALPQSGSSAVFDHFGSNYVAVVNASGAATSISLTANGTPGSYNATALSNGATGSAVFSLTNNKAPTTTTVQSTPNPVDLNRLLTLTAFITSNAGIPTGTVQFKDGGVNIGEPAQLDANGAATKSTVSLTAGSHVITAEYSGDTNFLASTGTLSGGQQVLPGLSISDVSTAEGDSGPKTLSLTVTLAAASNQTITVNYATANGTATAGSDYVSSSGTLTFNPGDLTQTIPVTINGDQKFEPDENFFVNLSNPTNATISDNQGIGTILNDDAQGGIISFSASQYTVSEADGSVTITVNRSGDTTAAATVDYATDDTGSPGPCSDFNGFASSKCDFTTAVGTLRFAANETQKTIVVLVNRDSYLESGFDAFFMRLSNLTGGAVFGANSTASVLISDSAGTGSNVIDDSAFFVRQHYHDFLNREPDASGLQFWTNEIESCGTDAGCREVKRINVSGAFFLSIEFQQTGYLIERLYKTAYGDATAVSHIPPDHNVSVPIVIFNEFLADTQEIGRGVIVGQGDWQQQLENNKAAFVTAFVQRQRFTNAFGSISNAQFVNTLNANAGTPMSQGESDQLVADLNSSAKTRAQVLRVIAEHPNLVNAEFNRAFVLMQYFGYLRRDPDATGYDFWLTKLNQFGGNFQNAEMVKAFISADEYRHRFGN